MSQLFHIPIVRHVVILLAIIGLIVFCIDKSRQNQRTRNALYNCIYVLYAAAVFKTLQVIDAIGGNGSLQFFIKQVACILVVICSLFAYKRWFPKQDDIPFNSVFRLIGWVTLVIVAALQICFAVLLYI